MGYCESIDVGMRLGLNNAQRQQAATKLESHIRRASIEIDQEFNYYGRSTPSSALVESIIRIAREIEEKVLAFGEPENGWVKIK